MRCNESEIYIYIYPQFKRQYFLQTIENSDLLTNFTTDFTILGDPWADWVGARESLNGWKNKARRKVKNGEKSPWGQSLTRPVPNGRCLSGFWLVPEKHKFSGTNQKPERRRPFGTGLVRHCPQGLFSPFFTFLCAIFSRPFRLSLAPTICPWVSEDEILRICPSNL